MPILVLKVLQVPQVLKIKSKKMVWVPQEKMVPQERWVPEEKMVPQERWVPKEPCDHEKSSIQIQE